MHLPQLKTIIPRKGLSFELSASNISSWVTEGPSPEGGIVLPAAISIRILDKVVEHIPKVTSLSIYNGNFHEKLDCGQR